MFNKKFLNALTEEALMVWPENWEEIKAAFNKITFAVSIEILINRLGLFQKENESETFDSIKHKIQSFDDSDYILKQMLTTLCEEGVLAKAEDRYICKNSFVEIASSSELLASAIRQFPEEGAFFQWLARSTGKMQDFIEGKLYGEEVMFPYGNFDLLEQFYNKSDVYKYYPKLAAKTLKRVLENNSHAVSILEIGAGTGNGTAILFNELGDFTNKIKQYTFSDISKTLLKKSEKKFANFNFIKYQIFDLNVGLEPQNIQKNSEDIVYGVNALHTARKVQDSCVRLYQILKKGGYFILGEASSLPNGIYRYMEFTFGMLNSFYNYEDKELRPNSPFISPNTWIDLLKQTGFSEVSAIPGESKTICETGGVIIAKK